MKLLIFLILLIIYHPTSLASVSCQLSFLWNMSHPPVAFTYRALKDGFGLDPLILELETLHQSQVLSRGEGGIGRPRRVERRTFHLGWILSKDFQDTRSAIVDYFVDGRTHLTFREWVTLWEMSYERAGGELDVEWTTGLSRLGGNGRTRFIREMLAEIGFAVQQQLGLRDSPFEWSANPNLAGWYQKNIMSDPLLDRDDFDEYYRRFHMRRTGLRAPTIPMTSGLRDMRRKLRDATQLKSSVTLGQPRYWYDLYSVSLAIDEFSLFYVGDGYEPIAEMMMVTASSDEIQIGGEDRFWVKIHKGADIFFHHINLQRIDRGFEPFVIQHGARNWADEIILQHLIVHYRDSLPALQSSDPEKIYFVNFRTQIYRDSSFRNVEELKKAFEARVEWKKSLKYSLKIADGQ